jgi:hypothetical protein
MSRFINVLEGLFLIYVSWRCFAYYKGWLQLSAEKEKRRLKIIESYGFLLLILGGVTLLCGSWLILS